MKGTKSYEEIEKEFWRCVDNNQGEKVQVDYAADLPANQYGIGETTEERKHYSRHPWNFNRMHMKANSLLQFYKDRGVDDIHFEPMRKHISGITMSWIYVGMLFSSF